MDEPFVFQPDRRLGLITHLVAILFLMILGGWAIWQAVQPTAGPALTLYLLLALIAFGLIPFLAYRLLALRNAIYILARDGIRLQWGLRAEDIPMDTIRWVQLSSEFSRPLPLPFFRLPGSVLGSRQMSGAGTVEYMASRSRDLVVISTGQRAFAISPEEPQAFTLTVRRLLELGSLTPVPARSVYPTFLLARVWGTPAARFILAVGLLLNIILFAWVSIQALSQPAVSLGFATRGEPVPAVRLLLLPMISSFFFIIDLIVGLFFFRRDVSQSLSPSTSVSESPFRKERKVYSDPVTEPVDMTSIETQPAGEPQKPRSLQVPNQVLAYLFWISGLITATLFTIAVVYILRAVG